MKSHTNRHAPNGLHPVIIANILVVVVCCFALVGSYHARSTGFYPASMNTSHSRPISLGGILRTGVIVNAAGNTAPNVLAGNTLLNHSSPRVVRSMGICIPPAVREPRDSQLAGHDHSRKPFVHAALLATRLWLLQDPTLIVMVLIAYSNKQEDVSSQVQKNFEDAGAFVWNKNVSLMSGAHACIQAAQVGRMFAFETGILREDDLVVTVDSDAFPVKVHEILAEFKTVNKNGVPYKVYVSHYDYAEKNSMTIPMTFVAMQCQTWRSFLKLDFTSTLQMGFAMVNYWSVDQTILTGRLWQSGLCTFPSRSAKGMMKMMNTMSAGASWDFAPTMADDSATCHHGTGEGRQCLSGPPAYDQVLKHRCNWVHFLPTVDKQGLDAAFAGISKVSPLVVQTFLSSQEK
jgi:hypothetical protein